MKAIPKILIADDEKKVRLALRWAFEEKGYQVEEAGDGDEAIRAVERLNPDVIILDLQMPSVDGMQVLKILKRNSYDGAVLILTAHGSIASAVEAVHAGAYDYLTKPFSNDELLLTVGRALENVALRRELGKARRLLGEKFAPGGIVTQSRAMQDLIDTVARVAPTDVPVLIYGESGTGKELIAKALHTESRRTGPFVAINCGSIPPNLVESELFGYEKGAFSGADRSKQGLVAGADGGTLFLDEISELSTEAQTSLLRFTQTGEFYSVGATNPVRVNARLVAASNRHLEDAVKVGDFREDLFYRLNVVQLKVLPLRERREDIPLLISHFIDRYGPDFEKPGYDFDLDSKSLLQAYHWPGNVRELENAVRSSLVLAAKHPMGIDALPAAVLGKTSEGFTEAVPDSMKQAVEEQQRIVEIREIQKALSSANGNRTQAAAQLGISRFTLLRRMKRYGIS